MWSNLVAFPMFLRSGLVVSETGHSGGLVGTASGQGSTHFLMQLMPGRGPPCGMFWARRMAYFGRDWHVQLQPHQFGLACSGLRTQFQFDAF